MLSALQPSWGPNGAYVGSFSKWYMAVAVLRAWCSFDWFVHVFYMVQAKTWCRNDPNVPWEELWPQGSARLRHGRSRAPADTACGLLPVVSFLSFWGRTPGVWCSSSQGQPRTALPFHPRIPNWDENPAGQTQGKPGSSASGGCAPASVVACGDGELCASTDGFFTQFMLSCAIFKAY